MRPSAPDTVNEAMREARSTTRWRPGTSTTQAAATASPSAVLGPRRSPRSPLSPMHPRTQAPRSLLGDALLGDP
jgi:hypothetical protein